MLTDDELNQYWLTPQLPDVQRLLHHVTALRAERDRLAARVAELERSHRVERQVIRTQEQYQRHFYDGAADLVQRLEAERDRLAAALRAMADHYVAIVHSGDCGSWDPDQELVVQQARAALAGTDRPPVITEKARSAK